MKEIILIIDPFSTGKLYAKEFNKYGFACFAFINCKIKLGFQREDFDKIFTDKNELISFLKTQKVKAILPGSEHGVEFAEQLAGQFNMISNDISVPDIRVNKFEMQKALKENNLNYIPTFIIKKSIIPEIPESNLGYILKPNKACASENVNFANTKTELLNLINDIKWDEVNIHGKRNEEFLLQTFIEGTEYVVDMVVLSNKKIKIASLCEYEKVEVNNSKFVYKSLNVLDPFLKEYKDLIDYAKKCAKALGFKVGPAHMEIKRDKNNHNKPVMIEVGARMHGGIAPNLFQHCYYPNLLEMSVKSYLGINDFNDSQLKKFGKIVFLINEIESIFKPNFEEFKQLSSYKGNINFANEGSMVPQTIDLKTCPGIFWLSSNSMEVLDKESKAIKMFR